MRRGTLNAETFGPNEADATFGPEVKFGGILAGMKPNGRRAAAINFLDCWRLTPNARFGVSLHKLSGKALYSIDCATEWGPSAPPGA